LELKLNSYDALTAFAKQLERNIESDDFHTKVVVTPSPIDEKGIVIKVSLLKTFKDTRTQAARLSRTLRIRVSVSGAAESMTGLKQALSAVEALDRYLTSDGLRLETENGKAVANSRILQVLNQEDSFFDSPDSTSVQNVQDDRFVLITFPTGGE
jgi:hypothetical protein